MNDFSLWIRFKLTEKKNIIGSFLFSSSPLGRNKQREVNRLINRLKMIENVSNWKK